MDIKITDESEINEMYLKNWRTSVANPQNSIRIGNTKIKPKVNNFVLLLIGALIFFLIFYIYLRPDSSNNLQYNNNAAGTSSYLETNNKIYDNTYPLSKPLVLNGQKIFKLGKIDIFLQEKLLRDKTIKFNFLPQL